TLFLTRRSHGRRLRRGWRRCCGTRRKKEGRLRPPLVVHPIHPPLSALHIIQQLKLPAAGRLDPPESPLALADPPSAHVAPAVDAAGDAGGLAAPAKRGGLAGAGGDGDGAVEEAHGLPPYRGRWTGITRVGASPVGIHRPAEAHGGRVDPVE